MDNRNIFLWRRSILCVTHQMSRKERNNGGTEYTAATIDTLQISAFFLQFSNFRKGRLLYIRPIGWSVGWSVGWRHH